MSSVSICAVLVLQVCCYYRVETLIRLGRRLLPRLSSERRPPSQSTSEESSRTRPASDNEASPSPASARPTSKSKSLIDQIEATESKAGVGVDVPLRTCVRDWPAICSSSSSSSSDSIDCPPTRRALPRRRWRILPNGWKNEVAGGAVLDRVGGESLSRPSERVSRRPDSVDRGVVGGGSAAAVHALGAYRGVLR
jgi:hypothetical protein